VFYEVQLPASNPGEKQIAALVVLTPSESKRLIAKAVVALPEVQNAFKNGTIIIGKGVTNAFVTEELLGIPVEPKGALTVGLVCGGITEAHAGPPATTKHVIRNGQALEGADSNVEILKFGPEDVFIKGANAIDPEGNVGVLSSTYRGGTIGTVWPVVTPRGSHLIMPVGLEKMVASVMAASYHSGIFHFKWSTGLPIKLIPVPGGKVVTEIEAFAVLAGVKAYHLASGGIGGSEGAVVLSLEGDEASVEKAFELTKSIKGEPATAMPEKFFVKCPAEFKYDAKAQLATLGGK
jgi:hypothetical protein